MTAVGFQKWWCTVHEQWENEAPMWCNIFAAECNLVQPERAVENA